MLEESLPSIWASMNSWFTPTVLFVLLNVMIGTIAVTSGIGTQKKEEKEPQLVRSPSVLQRLKSLNLHRFGSEEVNPFPSITTTLQPTETETVQTMEDQPHEENLYQSPEELEEPPEETVVANPDTFHAHHVTRTKSDTKPSAGELPEKLPRKMKKSASSNSAFRHFEEEEIVNRQRPSTVREGRSSLPQFGDDEEVDAKADDFINKFKQQLKLQRIDSIIRYKEMLNRGAAAAAAK